MTGIGSSPRVWGTPALDHAYLRELWFIPACVGNSRRRWSEYEDDSVHPRVCGELDRIGRGAQDHHGSSPRVWGTRLPGLPVSPCTVHPRVCGELDSGDAVLVDIHGSSPRVWGTPPKDPPD